MSDLPIENNLDQPVEESTTPSLDLTYKSKKLMDHEGAIVGAMRASQQGLDTEGTFVEINGAKATLNAYDMVAAEEREEERKAVAEAYAGLVDGVEDVGAIRETTEAARETLDNINKESETASGKYNPYIRALSTTLSSEEEMAREAGLQAIREDLIKLQENVSGWDIAESIGKSLIPGASLKDAGDLAKGTDLSAEELLGSMVATFKNSSPEKQQELWPLYKEFLFEAIEEPEAVSVLSSMLDPANDSDVPFDFNAVFLALDALDVGATAVGIAAGAARLIKNTNSIRTAHRLGNDDVASTLNDAVVSDKTGRTAEAIGETRAQAADNAAGIASDPNYTAGLNQYARARIEALRADGEGLVRRIEEEDVIAREPILSKARREQVKDNQVKGFKTKLQQEGATVTDSRIISSDDRGFSIEFDVDYDTTSGPSVGTERFSYTYKIDDVGALEDVDMKVFQGVRSPLGIFTGDVQEVVKGAIRLEEQSAAVKFEFNKLVNKALEPITSGIGNKVKNIFGSPSAKRINKVLESGSNSVETYTVQQLRRGVNGVKLNEKEIETYYNLRNVYDTLWWADNNNVRKVLLDKGYKQVPVGIDNHFVKIFDDIPPTTSRQVYNPETDKLQNLKQEELQNLYDTGYRVGKADGYISANGNRYSHVLVKKEDISEIPTIVKPYREGYVPRIREKGLYYVKTSSPTKVDGVSVEAFGKGSKISTIRSFDTKKQADEFAQSYPSGAGEEVRVLQDRELEAESVMVSGVEGTGLFRGHRAKEEVLHGVDGEAPVIMNPLEALGRNITFISNKISRSEWRLARQQEWINTANKHLDTHIDSFLAPLPNTEKGKVLERLRNDIKVWGRIEDQGESDLSNFFQKVFEYASNKGGIATPLASAARRLRDGSPEAQVRGAAFHTLLGWFNPVQLWVQAQGAIPALSIGARHAPKALYRQHALSMVEYVDDASVIAKTAKRMGMDAESLASLKDLYNRTGIGKAIRSNADFNDAVSGGTSSLRQLSDKGLIFYRMGEGFSRRTAFNVAVAEWQAANKGRKLSSINNDELRSIMTRTNNFLLNLNKANAAQWQRGVLSIPTQFMQVTAKAWANMTPEILGGTNQFTASEKLKLMAGQVAMYGVNGAPFGYAAYQAYMSLTGKTQEDLEAMSESEVAAMNGGIQGLMFYNLFGHELVIGPRGSLASGYNSLVELLLERRMPLVEALSGPFGTVFKRTLDASQAFRAITVDFEDPQYTLQQAGEAFINATGIISSSRNMQKAWEMWHYGWILSQKGDVLAQDFEYAESIAAGLGFQLQREASIYAAKDVGKARAELRSSITQQLKSQTIQFLKLKDEVTEKDIERFESFKRALLSNPSLSPFDREKIKDSHAKFLKGIVNRDTEESRALKRMIDNYGTSLQEDFKSITSSGIIQLDDTEYEEFNEELK